MYQNLKKGLAGKIKSHFKNALHAMLVVTLDSESGQVMDSFIADTH